MNNNLDNPYYYLENFQFVLSWVRQRYGDLLEPGEIDFIERFAALPVEPRALLVRMVMRKGDLFRASKLRYEEIGDTRAALHCLIAQGWVEADPPITLEQLFALLTKQEFAQALDLAAAKGMKKADLLTSVQLDSAAPRRFSAWCASLDDALVEVRVGALCERIRLMFFGNLYQDWSEFVLSDLGIYAYEKVAFFGSVARFSPARRHRCLPAFASLPAAPRPGRAVAGNRARYPRNRLRQSLAAQPPLRNSCSRSGKPASSKTKAKMRCASMNNAPTPARACGASACWKNRSRSKPRWRWPKRLRQRRKMPPKRKV